MYQFHENLYTDIRIEKTNMTFIYYVQGRLENILERTTIGAFIRVFDGYRWYYSSTTNIEHLQNDIDRLSALAKPNPSISSHPYLLKLQVNKGKNLQFKDKCVTDIPIDDKNKNLSSLFPQLQSNPRIALWRAIYKDKYIEKTFFSSLGADFVYDWQDCGFAYYFDLIDGDKKFSEGYEKASNFYNELCFLKEGLQSYLAKCEHFLLESEPVAPGKYPVILSPFTAGIFAHESFGHKSEADFMIGDETMKKEWAIGKQVGSPILTIVDDGNEIGSGYISFDDEGTKPEKTFLIKNGILSGRLHSALTAVELNEETTGNARSISFQYEPIVRMTSTYILSGDRKKEDLIAEVDNGFYIEKLRHGSGMSTFTLAPSLAYKIENGKITNPVQISVITGNVFETLNLIDGLSDDFEILSFTMGGCGKGEQANLPVSFGGPYVRIKSMNVQ